MGMTDPEKRALKGSASRPNLAELPTRVTRDDAAGLLTRHFFKTSPRTLERWPLAWRRLNGKAHCETTELFAVAEAMLNDAPVVMGGKQGS
jgi:hypothetical protein